MGRYEPWYLDLGARPLGPVGTRVRVWAPKAKRVAVRIVQPPERLVELAARELGYFEATVPGVGAGDRYLYVLDGRTERPDPVSRFQPEGVHGPSAVVDPDAFRWTDDRWRGLPLKDIILYELHVGTFTPEGTFESLIPRLKYLKDELGVTAIELMPVAQFPGRRNWGYDGVYPFAPQNTYGGPNGLKRLVDACHAKGMAVILDVVYNHLGPEGNYLSDFGPYFTDRYRTPWGSAINYDGPDSDEVRHYVISNGLYWITEFHLDGLRLDAIHGIYDFSPRHILRDLAEAVHVEAERLGRTVLVVAESDLNDVRVIEPPAQGGYGLGGQWSDDFHHALHAVLSGERAGYYQDFGCLEHLATAWREGFVLSGQRSAYRRRRHGTSSRNRPLAQFIVCAQNHDQVGNRPLGDRLAALVPWEALRVAAAAVLLSPSVPLLFMGEEYGEMAPFQYFTDHGDPGLADAVRNGRRLEFTRLGWQNAVPDPQDPATFERSCLHPELLTDPRHAGLLRWYQALTHLRKTLPALGAAETEAERPAVWAHESERVLVVHRRHRSGSEGLLVLGFNHAPVTLSLREPVGRWKLTLASTGMEFGGASAATLGADLVIAEDGATLALPSLVTAVYAAQSSALSPVGM